VHDQNDPTRLAFVTWDNREIVSRRGTVLHGTLTNIVILQYSTKVYTL
jgi:hypothetical protein